MNRRFRLATVESLRSREVDRAAQSLGAARRSLVEAETSLESLRTQLDACMPKGSAAPWDVTAAANRREALRDLEARAGAEVDRLRTSLEAATALWRAARADLGAVEALHDKHRQAVTAEDARREQLLTDDLASALRAFPGLHQNRTPVLSAHGRGPGGDAA